MPDYQEMYLKMLKASEQAINILIEAQQECEELYISENKKGVSEEKFHPIVPAAKT
jgi:hypothetical protein